MANEKFYRSSKLMIYVSEMGSDLLPGWKVHCRQALAC